MANIVYQVGNHDAVLAGMAWKLSTGHWGDTHSTYTFENFFHPFLGELIGKLNRDSLAGMLDATWQDGLKWDSLVPKQDSTSKSFDEL